MRQKLTDSKVIFLDNFFFFFFFELAVYTYSLWDWQNYSVVLKKWYGKTSIAIYRLLVTSWKLKTTSWNLKSRVQIHELPTEIHKLKFTSYEFISTSSRII